MENVKPEQIFGITFGTITAFYICIVFPLQVRYYILKSRRQKLQRVRRSQTIDNQSNTSANARTVTDLNVNNRIGGISDHRLDLGNLHTPLSTSEFHNEIEVAAARHLEAEHRQQIIEIQREIERQAIQRRDERESYLNASHMPSRVINSNTVCEYRQQVIDMQTEIEQQAIRRQDELQMQPNTLNLPPRLINSSTVRSSIFTITSGNVKGISNYPNAPTTPESDEMKEIHFPDRSSYEDEGLPSYDQAVAFDSKTTSVTICRY